MKTPRLWFVMFGIAALAMVVAIASRGDAAPDKPGFQKIVDLIKAGKTTEAKAEAKKFADKNGDFEDLMAMFVSTKDKKKKGFYFPANADQTLSRLGRDTQSPTALGKADLQDLGVICAAGGMVCGNIPCMKKDKESVAEWAKWAKDIEEYGVKLQDAVKTKTPADVKANATKVYNACVGCHQKYK